MPFDPNDAAVFISTYPDGMLKPELIGFFAAHGIPLTAIHSYNWRDVNIARNRAIKTLALPSGKTHLIFADNDIVPSQRTDSFFQADADAVGAMFDLPDMASWSDPEMIHFGLVRFHRHVLAAIQPPWFQRVYTPDGAGLVKCGCLYLRDKIKEKGFRIARAGWCGHEIKASWE